MRLRKIKLSGFKSFVDPTTLIVPGNLVGIVGPNGCGKSNIIDAVTWVMGESSAKHLRGDALTDVIFNGSNSRQPVGQASVELVFDNSEGKASGQYAAYNEISIKRQINREGISTYLLNGTRCRRKDIQGLFLGTGLGPRSYSIIEQGMISRLIEAKPDELRVFIEEAAGISKFRERRRETENRIRHTKENLNRLNDIREELDKQLSHLQRQARAAERYQVLKQEQRQLQAELLALSWRDFNAEIQQRNENVRVHENRVEEKVAALRKIESGMVEIRDTITAANETFNQFQSDYYQVGGDISQLEQKIQHAKERITTLERDIAKAGEAIVAVEQQQAHDRELLAGYAEKTRSLEPQLQGFRSDSNQAYEALNEAEQAMQDWQSEWDSFQETGAEFSRQIEVDQTRQEHLEAGLAELRHRRQMLTRELEAADQEERQGELQKLEADIADQCAGVNRQRAELETGLNAVRASRDTILQAEEQLSALRSGQQQLAGKIASLEALQHGELGGDQEQVEKWLVDHGQEKAPRLIERLSVEKEWAHALETVLGRDLQSICINDVERVLQSLASLTTGQLSIISDNEYDNPLDPRYPRLLDKMTSEIPLGHVLGGIYIADNLQKAQAMYADLSGAESVITRDGIWLGPGWIRVNRRDAAQDGVIAREQTIKSLKSRETAMAAEIEACRVKVDCEREKLEQMEQRQHEAQKQLNEQQDVITTLRSRQAEIKARYEQSVQRRQAVRDELEELDEREESGRQEQDNLGARLERTRADFEKLSAERARLSERRARHQQRLEEARSRWQKTHEHSHEIALELESLSSKRASLEQALKRSDIQIGSLAAGLAELENSLRQNREPVPGLEQALEAKLAVRIETEKKLNQARERMQQLDGELRTKEQERLATEQGVSELRTELENVRLEAQGIRVRLQTVEEQLQTAGHQPEALLGNMDTEAGKPAWQEKLESVERRINRLGPINLAAIDEFSQLSERKNYLDSQNEDLTQALQTLENAIRKIDKETRTRFKETFDKLNANLKSMFPVLFGGGHAYLEMTGEDLLETGVSLMAQPPGKRNTNIHLLSGGEKALTAVALVFAIFKLNPAPFCILDEVDAPLDDNNTGRFSRLVTEMSKDVQFVFITHNKITMEIAQQLLGVTMHEAGVSRLVSVDMDEAVQMAATA